MNYWTKRFSPGNLFEHCITRALLCLLVRRTLWRLGQPAQGLDDLEDILNSPAPALDSTSVDRHLSSSAVCLGPASAPQSAAPAHSTDSGSAAAPSAQGLSGNSAASSLPDLDQLTQLPRRTTTDAADSKKASVWITAYQSASIPLAAAWASIPEKLHNLPCLTVGSLSGCQVKPHLSDAVHAVDLYYTAGL